jgi:ABC-type Fe3+/spermidine/putrescine transport system ATPase subunit
VPNARDLLLVVRSEKLRLADARQAENAIPVTVRSRIFQGESQLLIVELRGGTTLTFRLSTHIDTDGSLPEPGEQARLSLHPQHAFVVAREGDQPSVAVSPSPVIRYGA